MAILVTDRKKIRSTLGVSLNYDGNADLKIKKCKSSSKMAGIVLTKTEGLQLQLNNFREKRLRYLTDIEIGLIFPYYSQ